MEKINERIFENSINFEVIKKRKKAIRKKNFGLSFKTVQRRVKFAYPVMLKFTRVGWNDRNIYVEFCPLTKNLVLTLKNSRINHFSGKLDESYIYNWQPNELDLNSKDWYEL